MSPRTRTHRIERELRAAGQLAAGVDEVGRGPLAGPVVACAIVMPAGVKPISGVVDSKMLSKAARDRLAPLILQRAIAVGIGAASVREIERVNILRGTVLAIRRAYARISVSPQVVLVDGRQVPGWEVAHTSIIDGDAKCYCIACASIVAKVTRDRLMTALAARYPGYGWERNSGYATEEHRDAIERLGVTRHHRLSFIYDAQRELGLEGLRA